MVRYWDYPTATSPYWGGSSTRGGLSYRSYSSAATTNSSTYSSMIYVRIIRQYLVKAPEHWSKTDVADYVFLVNDATQTGFKVTMVINDGDIDITDPNVEKRDMADFVPLMLSKANPEDQEKIRAFFAEHPIDPPSEIAA